MPAQTIISPVDGSAYARFDYATDAEADAVLARARAAQRDWSLTTLAERQAVCRRFVAAMLADKERIGAELTRQMGRPIAYSPKEVGGLAERANSMIDAAERGLAALEPGDGRVTRRIERVPHGVCLIVAPWNYPYLTAVNSIVPAILAGNAVILKPAAQTKLTGDRFADGFAAAGLPEGVFTSIPLTHDTVGRWLGDRAVDFVAFTGSVRGGGEIERAAAGRFLPVALELGGKDPGYVRADADLDFSAAELVDGAFFNSGQSCCGIERIYVDRKVYAPFVERFVQITRDSQKLGDPTDPATTLGPVVSLDAAGGIVAQVEAALAAGAKALVGGMPRDTAYLPATVLVDVDHTMAVMTEETFGPVVGIMAVDGDDEAVRLMNDSRYGLTASIWSADRAAALALGQRVETGTLFVNRCDYLDPALAWVGIKDSGRGCALSELGFHAVTRPKSFYAR